MSGTSIARRTAQIAGTSALALVASALTFGTASAAVPSGVGQSGTLDCSSSTVAADGGRLVANWSGVQKDRNNYTEAERAGMERNFQALMASRNWTSDIEDIKDPVVVETYVHIVREDGTVDGGNIPRTWIREQMKYFNHSFRGHGHGAEGARSPFKFKLAGVTRTTNADWYAHADQPAVERAMKTALREESSTAETLNVYLTNLIQGGLLGYAYLPEDYEQVGVLDGVVVESQSLPGGTADPYNLGGTVAHEVGHWLGLYHTFDGGCSGPGDYVDDTPAQSSPSSGCPVGRDSCVDDQGPDPIHNYMDYSEDACYNQFTIGQRERMYDQWFMYRDGVE